MPKSNIWAALAHQSSMEGRVLLGNLRPRTNELNRCRALEGCAYGTIWAAPLTVAKVNKFPYSVAQPPTYHQPCMNTNYFIEILYYEIVCVCVKLPGLYGTKLHMELWSWTPDPQQARVQVFVIQVVVLLNLDHRWNWHYADRQLFNI